MLNSNRSYDYPFSRSISALSHVRRALSLIWRILSRGYLPRRGSRGASVLRYFRPILEKSRTTCRHPAQSRCEL